VKRRQPFGLRVLLVEDQFLIAEDIETLLKEIGCVVVGPLGRLATALPVARTEDLDAAILDVNLDDGLVYPVAAELTRRQIPYLFITGYIRQDLAAPFHGRPILAKPFSAQDIEAAIWALCGT
jgi:DNA-binding response OmpR family regulator